MRELSPELCWHLKGMGVDALDGFPESLSSPSAAGICEHTAWGDTQQHQGTHESRLAWIARLPAGEGLSGRVAAQPRHTVLASERVDRSPAAWP